MILEASRQNLEVDWANHHSVPLKLINPWKVLPRFKETHHYYNITCFSLLYQTNVHLFDFLF